MRSRRFAGDDHGAAAGAGTTRRRWSSATAAAGSIAPATVDALAELLLEQPEATIVAGATDVGLWVTKQLRVLDPVIYLGRVRELQQIEETDDGIDDRRRRQPTADAMAALAALLSRTSARCSAASASVQIRNAGTIGGNIANGSPIGDSPPALIAPGARARTCAAARSGASCRWRTSSSPTASRTGSPASSSSASSCRSPQPGTRFRAYKLCQALRPGHLGGDGGVRACSSTAERVTAARIAFGGMAATPKRAAQREAALRRQALERRPRVEAAMAALAQDFTPITDMRASAGYRAQGRRATCCGACIVETTTAAPRPGSSATGAWPMSDARSQGGVARCRDRMTAPPGTSPARRSISTTCRSRLGCCTSSSASAPRRMRGS